MQTGSEESAVRAVHSSWIEAVNAGDVSRLLTLMTDDVVFLNPGREPLGREEFPHGFRTGHERAFIQCVSEIEEVAIFDQIAYTRCQDSLSVRPRSGGATMKLAGHRITIYRKQPDSRWLLARDVHTISPVSA